MGLLDPDVDWAALEEATAGMDYSKLGDYGLTVADALKYGNKRIPYVGPDNGFTRYYTPPTLEQSAAKTAYEEKRDSYSNEFTVLPDGGIGASERQLWSRTPEAIAMQSLGYAPDNSAATNALDPVQALRLAHMGISPADAARLWPDQQVAPPTQTLGSPVGNPGYSLGAGIVNTNNLNYSGLLDQGNVTTQPVGEQTAFKPPADLSALAALPPEQQEYLRNMQELSKLSPEEQQKVRGYAAAPQQTQQPQTTAPASFNPYGKDITPDQLAEWGKSGVNAVDYADATQAYIMRQSNPDYVSPRQQLTNTVVTKLNELPQDASLEDIRKIVEANNYSREDGVFGEQAYTPDYGTILDAIEARGISLVQPRGDNGQFTIPDIGLLVGNPDGGGKDHLQEYTNELVRRGLLPESPTGGYDLQRQEDGTFRGKVEEDDFTFGDVWSKLIPVVMGGLATGGLAPVIGGAGAGAAGGGITSLTSGGSTEDVLKAGLAGGLLGGANDFAGNLLPTELEKAPEWNAGWQDVVDWGVDTTTGILGDLNKNTSRPDANGPMIGNTQTNSRPGWHWEDNPDPNAIPGTKIAVKDDPNAGGGDTGGGSDTPAPEGANRGEVNPEDIWVFNNGTLTNTATGATKAGGRGMENGVEYTGDGDRIGEQTEEPQDDNSGLLGLILAGAIGGPAAGIIMGQILNGGSGGGTGTTTGTGGTPTGGTGGGTGTGDGLGLGPGEGSGIEQPEPPERPDRPIVTPTGGIPVPGTPHLFQQDTSTRYQQPQYAAPTQKSLFDVNNGGLRAPMVLPAENAGQDTWEQWLEKYFAQGGFEQGLLTMIAGPTGSKGSGLI